MLRFTTFLELPDDVLFSIFKLLEWEDMIHLDIAITSKKFRENWKRQLESYRGGNYSCVAQNKEGLNVFSILLLPRGKVATGQLSSQSHTIGIWDVETLCLERELTGHQGKIHALTLLSDGRLASGACDTDVRIWNLETNECEVIIPGYKNPVYCLAELPGGGRIAIASFTFIFVWNILAGRGIMMIEAHPPSIGVVESVKCLTLLKDGRLASGSTDKLIKLWDLSNEDCTMVLVGHSCSVNCILQLSDGRLVSGSDDGSVRIWNLVDGHCERSIDLILRIRSFIRMSDGRFAIVPNMFSESTKGVPMIRLWGLGQEGSQVRVLTAPLPAGSSWPAPCCLVELADGRLVSGGNSHGLLVWSPEIR